MRILILTQWFEPEPTLKGLTFARELRRRGHEVEVVTGFPNYPGGKLYPGYRIRLWQRETIAGVSLLRVPLYPSHDRSALGRVLNYVSFAFSASILGWALSRRPDVLYVYHPPATIGLPAIVGRRLLGVPVVYDVQDLWPDTVVASGMLRNRVAVRVIDSWCRFVYSQADRIVVLSPGFRDALIARGVPATKIDVIYNWSDEAAMDLNQTPAVPTGASGEFTVLFAGTMGTVQALDAVLEAARLCRTTVPQARFVFVGGGVDRDRLERKANEMHLDNVRILPRQPMAAMGSILAAADVLLVHLKDDPLFRMTIPSKTQAYLAAGRPILIGVRGDAADLVSRSGGGILCEPENPSSIAEGVRRLFQAGSLRLAEMGRKGRAFYERELSMRVAIDKFDEVFRQVCRTCPRGKASSAEGMS